MPGKIKVFVRSQLWIETPEGGKAPAGARLYKGEGQALFPRECMTGEAFNFTFDDPETAEKAARALENYSNKTEAKAKR